MEQKVWFWQENSSLYVQIWVTDKLEGIVNCEWLCSDGVIDFKPTYKENNEWKDTNK